MHSPRSLQSSLVTLAVTSFSFLLAGCQGASSEDQKASLFAATCPDPTPWSTTLDGIAASTVIVDSRCDLVVSGEVVDAASARLGDQKLDLQQGWFAMKIGGDGKLAWAKNLGELGSAPSNVTVAATADGDVVVGGVFAGTLALASGNLVAGADHSFVARLDGNGSARWGRLLPGDVAAVDVDLGTGEPVVVGSFTGTLDLGGASLKSVGGSDIFVLRLDGDGSTKKATSIGGDTNDAVTFVAMADDGGLAISGGWGMPASTVCDENNACSPYDERYGFIARVDAEGQLVWKKQVQQGGALISAGALAASPNGDVMVWESDSPTFHVFGDDGAERWHKTFDPFTNGTARYDAAGELVLAGYFFGDGSSSPDFGGGPVTPQTGPNDAYVAKLDGEGAHAYSASFGNANIGALDVTAGGALAVAGGLGGDANLGSGVLKAGKTTSFVARFGAKTLASH